MLILASYIWQMANRVMRRRLQPPLMTEGFVRGLRSVQGRAGFDNKANGDTCKAIPGGNRTSYNPGKGGRG